MPTRAAISRFQTSVIEWFASKARKLPWRQRDDAYGIWISEVMLQQTGVSTVVPYYEKFLKKFPTLKSLASAREEDVLKLWEGLGYYRRARHIRAAAQMIVEKFDGAFPSTREELLTLPGIGAYSAGALLSIAFRKKAPALDGNLIRVYSRFYALREPVDTTPVLKKLWALAETHSPDQAAITREFAEGMMEIGALVCRPAEPLCSQCPLAWGCIAFKRGLIDKIPRKSSPMERQNAYERIYWFKNSNRIAILPKESDRRYPGFHRLPFDTLSKPLDRKPDFRYSITSTNYSVWLETNDPTAQGLPRNVHLFRKNLATTYPRASDFQWTSLKKLKELTLPAIDRKIIKRLSPLLNLA